MTPLLRLVVVIVRAWTDCYTWRMDPDVRAARIAQIESDLWEELRERSSEGMRLPLSIVARLVLGIPDDLAWRTTHDLIFEGSVKRSAAFGAIVSVVTLIAAIVVWVGIVMAPAKLPEPPSMMLFSAAPGPPPPPPPPPPHRPPPPPCQPPAFTAGCR